MIKSDRTNKEVSLKTQYILVVVFAFFTHPCTTSQQMMKGFPGDAAYDSPDYWNGDLFFQQKMNDCKLGMFAESQDQHEPSPTHSFAHFQKPTRRLFSYRPAKGVTFDCSLSMSHWDDWTPTPLPTVDEYAKLYADKKWDEHRILNQPLMYYYDNFVEFAQQFESYDSYIDMFYRRYRNYSWIRKVANWFISNYCVGLANRFVFLKKQCDERKRQREEQRLRAEQYQKERAIVQKKLVELDELYAHTKDLLNTDDNKDQVPEEHRSARLATCANIQQELAFARQKMVVPDLCFSKAYSVDDGVVSCAQDYHIKKSYLTSFIGNAYEQQLHREHIEQLTQTHALSQQYALPRSNVPITALAQIIHCGLESNRKHHGAIATIVTNVGWAVLDVVKGFGDGIKLCGEHTYEMLRHPVMTVENITFGLCSLTYLIVSTCVRIERKQQHWEQLIDRGDFKALKREVKEAIQYMSECAAFCAETMSTWTVRGVVKHTTAFVLDCAVFHGLLTFAKFLCTTYVPPLLRSLAVELARLDRIPQQLRGAPLHYEVLIAPEVISSEKTIATVAQVGNSCERIVVEAEPYIDVVPKELPGCKTLPHALEAPVVCEEVIAQEAITTEKAVEIAAQTAEPAELVLLQTESGFVVELLPEELSSNKMISRPLMCESSTPPKAIATEKVVATSAAESVEIFVPKTDPIICPTPEHIEKLELLGLQPTKPKL
ncbi:MAG: hypothetical protein WBQ73_00325, partial [Candidatus Babeliales bacterium]